ncbi:flavodoxin [Clostridium sp. cel8]|uniref:flavodoxin n=1 Tax=unclassified Clostridium TaxID=2614128 RepID=UPI0015F36A16|nr:flavodoxin [Clostridium sp. cel8]MBA5851104.1 flavodoxin [Clostridium sp. cel8]
MKKVAIIYWSNGGNVEVLADEISKGAKSEGADVVIKQVQDAKVEDVTSADAVAFGSPSMDNNRIEQKEMAPFINEFKLLPSNNKKTVLFGSYGWDEGAFLEDFEKTVTDYGFEVVGKLAVNEAPSDDQIKKAEELGKLLAK